MSSLKYIFVHGLSGWGSYDAAYRRMPYWGMRGGDLIAFLRERGYDSSAASVSPAGAPSVPLDKSRPEAGKWNVFPTVRGDHMYLQGGLTHRHDIRPFYLDLLEMIDRL